MNKNNIVALVFALIGLVLFGTSNYGLLGSFALAVMGYEYDRVLTFLPVLTAPLFAAVLVGLDNEHVWLYAIVSLIVAGLNFYAVRLIIKDAFEYGYKSGQLDVGIKKIVENIIGKNKNEKDQWTI